MKKFYLHNGTEQQGPFDIDELKAKNINSNTSIWYDGLSAWTIAGNIEELKEIIKNITPPPFITNQIQQPTIPKDVAKPTQKSNPSIRRVFYFVSILTMTLVGLFVFNTWQQQDKLQQEQTEKTRIKNSITSYVTASRSGYAYSEFGGISKLSINVKNGTRYVIDNVRVKVSYIKADGGIWKEEYVDSGIIEAFGEQTQKAPDSDRGTSVEYSIVSIKSNVLGLY